VKMGAIGSVFCKAKGVTDGLLVREED